MKTADWIIAGLTAFVLIGLMYTVLFCAWVFGQ